MSHQDNSNGEQFSRKGVKYFVAALKEFIHDADMYGKFVASRNSRAKKMLR